LEFKPQFLTNIGHEIRTSLHAILSATSLLSEGGLNAEQIELASIISESASSFFANIGDILDCSNLSDTVRTNRIEMSFRNSISSVLRVAQMEIKPGLELRRQINPNIPDLVKGDPLRVRQVLWNIVMDAINFTEAGSINVVMQLVKNEETNVEVMTEIIDTGIGVSSSAVGSLFTPFTRLDNSVMKQYKRTGLGLSICASLVKLMEGCIGFRPNPDGIGSIFWFTVTTSKIQSIPLNASIDDLSRSIFVTVIKDETYSHSR
jgi:osomolarity two-component system sensor histidine kinase TcsA